jgi:hypothetical protein
MKKLILAVIFIIFFSCNKNEPYTPPFDPKKAILGKWELIQIGHWPNMYECTPWGYTEYLKDSIISIHEYETGEYYISNMKYWIDDSLFHEKYIREDGHVFIQNYSYEFYEDKMRLNMLDALPIFETFIYQRIK